MTNTHPHAKEPPLEIEPFFAMTERYSPSMTETKSTGHDSTEHSKMCALSAWQPFNFLHAQSANFQLNGNPIESKFSLANEKT